MTGNSPSLLLGEAEKRHQNIGLPREVAGRWQRPNVSGLEANKSQTHCLVGSCVSWLLIPSLSFNSSLSRQQTSTKVNKNDDGYFPGIERVLPQPEAHTCRPVIRSAARLSTEPSKVQCGRHHLSLGSFRVEWWGHMRGGATRRSGREKEGEGKKAQIPAPVPLFPRGSRVICRLLVEGKRDIFEARPLTRQSRVPLMLLE